jgi:hypothetical protein
VFLLRRDFLRRARVLDFEVADVFQIHVNLLRTRAASSGFSVKLRPLAVVDFDTLDKLGYHRRGEFLKARVLSDEFDKLVGVSAVVIVSVKLRLERGIFLCEFVALDFIHAGHLREHRLVNSAERLVLVEREKYLFVLYCLGCFGDLFSFNDLQNKFAGRYCETYDTGNKLKSLVLPSFE